MGHMAFDYLKHGLSVIPTGQDKIPKLEEWKPYQKNFATEQELKQWFPKHKYIGIVAGKVSGNLEMIDFDDQQAFVEWRNQVEIDSPGLFEGLTIETTQNGGFHVVYRCPGLEIPGNQKLAQRKNGEEVKTLIETRGEGGYFVCAPSPGYGLKQGSFENVQEITKEERETLITNALALNEHVEPSKVIRGPRQSSNGLSPGDDFNERGDISALLIKHGWQHVKGNGVYEYLRRPGKDTGHSASVIEGKTFFVFSSNANPFEPNQSYSPFAVYTYLEHGGDFAAAARALSQQEYGEQQRGKKSKLASLHSLSQLRTRFDEKVEWLWGQHIAEGMAHLFNGREGIGKTANCIQIGKEILEANPSATVIWIASEGFVNDTVIKMEELEVDPDRFIILQNSDETYIFNFHQRSERKYLDEVLLECRENGMEIPIVFIDSIRGITPFDDNDSRIKNVMMGLNAIVCDKHGAALVYIDHWKKGGASNLLDKAVGTTAKTAAVRLVYSVTSVGEWVRKISLAKSNIFNHQPSELMSALSGHGLIIYEAGQKADSTLTAEAQRWLIKLFNQKTQWLASEIYEMGKKKGFSSHLLKKVKDPLGIRVEHPTPSDPWYWICETFME